MTPEQLQVYTMIDTIREKEGIGFNIIEPNGEYDGKYIPSTNIIELLRPFTVDDINDRIIIYAHELGHYFVQKNALLNNQTTDKHIHERFAWAVAYNMLKKFGFTRWDRFSYLIVANIISGNF